MKTSNSQNAFIPPAPIQNKKDTKYYLGLFEFPQGSSPKILWDNGGSSVHNREAFLLYVVNMPTDLRISVFNPKPTVIKSEYMGTSFVAIYVQIADIEARGFSRPTVLVIGHEQPEIASFLYAKRLSEFKSFAYKMQSNAVKIFPEEISVYAASLKHTMEKYPNSAKLLESKVGELDSMLKKVGVELAPDTKVEDRPPEFFTSINNELRPIETLTDFAGIKPELLKFVTSLPVDVVQCNSMWKAQKCVLDVVNASRESAAAEFQTLVKNRKIYDCLFSILSGCTLFVISQRQEVAVAMCHRIASLSPFENDIPICSKSDRMECQCLVYARSIPTEPMSGVSIVDLDKDLYAGIRCPYDSILLKESSRAENRSATLQMMLISNYLKKISYRFIRTVAEMSARAPQTRARMDPQMISIGFAENDLPLIKHWSKVVSKQSINSSAVNCYIDC